MSGRKGRLKAPCGTYGGYQRHRRAGEETCAGCRAANARYRREWLDRGARERDQQMSRVRTRAVWRLAEENRERFLELVIEELAKETA